MLGSNPCVLPGLPFPPNINTALDLRPGDSQLWEPWEVTQKDSRFLHLEDASTDAVYRKPKEKMLFVYEKTLEAWKEYRDMVSKEPAE